jgi:hypothetical protein
MLFKLLVFALLAYLVFRAALRIWLAIRHDAAAPAQRSRRSVEPPKRPGPPPSPRDTEVEDARYRDV